MDANGPLSSHTARDSSPSLSDPGHSSSPHSEQHPGSGVPSPHAPLLAAQSETGPAANLLPSGFPSGGFLLPAARTTPAVKISRDAGPSSGGGLIGSGSLHTTRMFILTAVVGLCFFGAPGAEQNNALTSAGPDQPGFHGHARVLSSFDAEMDDGFWTQAGAWLSGQSFWWMLRIGSLLALAVALIIKDPIPNVEVGRGRGAGWRVKGEKGRGRYRPLCCHFFYHFSQPE